MNLSPSRIKNIPTALRTYANRASGQVKETREKTLRNHHDSDRYLAKHAPDVRVDGADGKTEVDEYWNRHTVNSTPFLTARESTDFLEWRFGEYPLFREFAGLWGDHDGEVVLDYGCGPGNDVVGLLTHTNARKVIGMDISSKALDLTRRRVALHKVDTDRVELIKISDAKAEIPLEDNSIDYFQSMGVIHITTDPGGILKELHRVLKSGEIGRVMVYNQHSVWFHLDTAYVRMILDGKWKGLSVEEAFQKNTDGEDCPIARAYTTDEFGALCEAAGFDTTYVGGHLSKHELDRYAEHADAALADDRLAERHKTFLRELEFDSDGYPLWSGKYAGVGAVFELRS